MSTAERQKRYRERQAQKGRKALTVTLPVELIESLRQVAKSDGNSLSSVVEYLLKAGIKKGSVTNNAYVIKDNPQVLPTLTQLIDRIAGGVAVQDIDGDIARMVGGLAAAGFGAHEIKKQLNGCSFPTLSGKSKWTVVEVRELLRRA